MAGQYTTANCGCLLQKDLVGQAFLPVHRMGLGYLEEEKEHFPFVISSFHLSSDRPFIQRTDDECDCGCCCNEKGKMTNIKWKISSARSGRSR